MPRHLNKLSDTKIKTRRLAAGCMVTAAAYT